MGLLAKQVFSGNYLDDSLSAFMCSLSIPARFSTTSQEIPLCPVVADRPVGSNQELPVTLIKYKPRNESIFCRSYLVLSNLAEELSAHILVN